MNIIRTQPLAKSILHYLLEWSEQIKISNWIESKSIKPCNCRIWNKNNNNLATHLILNCIWVDAKQSKYRLLFSIVFQWRSFLSLSRVRMNSFSVQRNSFFLFVVSYYQTIPICLYSFSLRLLNFDFCCWFKQVHNIIETQAETKRTH